ncbi:MAG: YcxB family protein [Gemmatimonadota bacterium]|nr:YcxB family protein [Gemmatimonadota bacterium]
MAAEWGGAPAPRQGGSDALEPTAPRQGSSDAPEPTATEPIVVEFELTPEEWVDVAMEHNRTSEIFLKAVRQGRRSFALLVVAIAVLGFLGGYAFFSTAWLFAGLTAVALLPISFRRSQKRQYETFARDGIANGMFGTHRVRLTEEGIWDETDSYKRLTRWHAIDRVVDGPGSFLVYLGRNAFLPIPHSAFRDGATLRAFADRFFERMSANPGLPSPDQEG